MRSLLLSLFLLTACASAPEPQDFPEKGCFLLYDLKTEKFVIEKGNTCKEEIVACSTFKVPLAVMAFDSGVLKDEKQVLKWDGKKHTMVEAWNGDHNAETWMKNSVVWFSQRLTPMMGEKKTKDYLNRFDYGNKDLSAGLTDAWIEKPTAPAKLAISPYGQINFMKKLWQGTLPASQRSMLLTKKIMYLETSPNGFDLHGKTGSGFYDDERKLHLGWFIAHVKKGEKEYLSVMNFSDVKPFTEKGFGGMRAKEMTKKYLAAEGLW